MRRDANHSVLLNLWSFLAGVVGSSMVIRNLHAFWAIIVPYETYSVVEVSPMVFDLAGDPIVLQTYDLTGKLDRD